MTINFSPQEWGLTLISAALINNLLLVKFLGLCPMLGSSQQMRQAYGMAGATLIVLTLTATISFALYENILVPFNLEYLQIIVFILVIAATVQGAERIIKTANPLLHQVLGIYLPLITSNCAVLGLAMIAVLETQNIIEAAWYGFSAGLGFGLVLILFGAMRMKLEAADVPKAFAGAPIALITAGIFSLGFMGFIGIGA
jgi:electron transport complex protein RnfA